MVSIKKKKVELRSEKVRNIVGKTPSYLIRYGIIIITFALLILLVCIWFIPYPYYISTTANIYINPPLQRIIARNDGWITLYNSSEYVQKNDTLCQLRRVDGDTVVHIAKTPGKIFFNCNNNDYIKKNDLLFVLLPDSVKKICLTVYIPIELENYLEVDQEMEIIIMNNTYISNIVAIYPFLGVCKNNKCMQKVKISFSMPVEKILTETTLFSEMVNIQLKLSERSLLKSIFR